MTLSSIITLLQNVQEFSSLDEKILAQMVGVAQYRDVARGEALISEGEIADNLYIILKGRFVVLSGKIPIAELAMGEPVGELAFFAGGTRTASVVAARNSSVMCLTREAYDTLAALTPALSNGILAALSQRLARTVSSSPGLRPKAGKVCSIFPGIGQPLSTRFLNGLKLAIAKIDGWMVIDETDCPDEIINNLVKLTKWLEELETTQGNLILMCTDPEAWPIWRLVTANNSDTILIVAPKSDVGTDTIAPSALEIELLGSTLKSNIQLALYRETKHLPTCNTARWLKDRPVALHHHIALDSPDDFDRLGRFLRGEALGLVMCGGGSFATAHLGAIKAMLERGHKFDFIGGTSAGAATGAALAIGLDPSLVMDLCEDIFIKSKAMSRFTVPRYSVLDHHCLDEALQKHFGAFNVEDAPINFFSVATSLTTNDVSIIRRGPLWQSIRASTSLPGVFPPFLTDDGEVLIDGGLLDNVPITIMRELKPGPNVILNFLAGESWRAEAKYADLPTRGEAVFGFLLKNKRSQVRHPTVFSILSRAMVVNARKLLEKTEIGNDILINISTLYGMSFMDWTRGREQFIISKRQMDEALDQMPKLQEITSDKDFLNRLRGAADVINTS